MRPGHNLKSFLSARSISLPEPQVKPLIENKRDFINECFNLWADESKPIELVVDDIEILMHQCGITYLHKNQIWTVDGLKFSERDRFENDIHAEVMCKADLAEVIKNHLNFIKAFI